MNSHKTNHRFNLVSPFYRVSGPEENHGYCHSSQRGLSASHHSLEPSILWLSHTVEDQPGKRAWGLVEEVKP